MESVCFVRTRAFWRSSDSRRWFYNASPALAQTPGNAASFAVVAGSAVNVNGTGSVINGNVGVSPGSSITGLPANGTVTPPFQGNATTFVPSSIADAAQAAAGALFLDLSTYACVGTACTEAVDMSNVNFGPGAHDFVAGTVILPAGTNMTLTGTSTDIFIFRAKSDLTTFAGSTVTLVGGVDACNVYWQIPTQATLANDVLNSPFVGTVVAGTTVALNAGANLVGRALALTAAVTMAGKNTVGGCGGSTVLVTKNTGVTTDNGTFGFTGGLGSFNITTVGGTGTKTFTNVPPTVTPLSIAESVPSGWTLDSNLCASVTVPQAGTAFCSVLNTKAPPAPGTLIVKKTTVGGDGTFTFTGTAGLGAFSITTSGGTGTQTFAGLAPGPYAITEGAATGWTPTYSNCSPAAVPSGGTVTCTVTNTKVPTAAPGLLLAKSANPTTYTQVGQSIIYSYKVTNTGNTTLNGPFTVTDDKLGTFVCESSPGLPASLAPGASFTCTKNYTIKASDLGNAILPTNVTANINTGPWLAFVKSTQDTTITGAAPSVPNGVYPCWCIQDHVPTDLHNQPAKLFSTIGGSLPTDVASLAWGKVNYVLNHKIHGPGNNLTFLKDVQTAIWVLLGETNPEFGISATAQQMINAGNAHAGFVPGSGDIVAIIVYSDGMTVRPGSIQESICEMHPLNSIVNKATVKNAVVTSSQVQATIRQIKPLLP